MANTNITLKRQGATEVDVLYPQTIPSQVTGLLTSNKITPSLLPDFVFGGLKFIGTVSATNTTTEHFLGKLVSGTSSGLTVSRNLSTEYSFSTMTQELFNRIKGSYFVATSSVSLGNDDGNDDDGTFQDNNNASVVFDDGVVVDDNSVIVEAGDWIVVTGYSSGTLKFSIINNTYALASATTSGVVSLSNITATTGATGNAVITQGVIAGLVGTTAGKIAAGNHTHSDYQPIDTDLTGIAALTGTNSTTHFLKKTLDSTGIVTWSLDSGGYLSSANNSTQTGFFGNIALQDDTNPSHYLTITASSDLTANRTLSLITGDLDRSLTLSGNLSVGANFTTTTGAVTINAQAGGSAISLPAAITLPTVAANQILIGTSNNTVGTLAATTIGRNLLGVADIADAFPRFIRLNATETVDVLTAENFRTAIGAGTSSTTGTVTQVATDGLALTGGPITTSGTITHSTAAGYKHIPSVGAEGAVLAYGDSSGTAQWETNTTGWTRMFYLDTATAPANTTFIQGDIIIEF